MSMQWIGRRYDEDAALTFGKAISGMFAHAKGKSIGVIEGKAKDAEVLFPRCPDVLLGTSAAT